MDQLRLILAGISKQLKQLSISHRIAAVSTALLLLAILVVVAQWTGKPDLSEVLPAASPADQQKASDYLGTQGFKVVLRNGKMYLPTQDASRARTMLAESGQMPNDKILLFENLIEKNSWTNSRDQNDRNYLNALMNELGRTIGRFHGVKSAKVLIDIPETQGLGAAVRKPTASATVWTESGQAMPQSMVNAVAGFISGSRAGLDVNQIRIIDGSTGNQRKATSEDDALSTSYLDQAARVEAQTREKVLQLLHYIPGVIVAVTAQVDVTRVTAQVQKYLPENEGTVSAERKKVETTNNTIDSSGAAEPGPASNQAADINRAGGAGSGSRTELSETTTETENHVGSRTETIVDPRGHPTMVAVSVNVPRGYVIASLAKPAALAGTAPAAAPAAPTEAEIDAQFAKVKSVIVASIKNQVRAMTVLANSAGKPDPKALDALVSDSIGISLIPLDLPPGLEGSPIQQAGILGSLAGGGGGTFGMGSGLIDKGILGFLACAAMGMMVMMVRKAGKKQAIPTPEELVGLPPALEAQADVIGEADEGEMAMEGIEVNEDEMQSQKMLEQVGELVGQNPESAAKMINRWINVEE